MAISFVGSKSHTIVGAGSGTFNLSLTDLKDTAGNNATLAENDIVIINFCVGTTVDVAYSTPTGWTKELEQYISDGQDVDQHIFWKRMGSTPDTSVDLTNSLSTARGITLNVMAFRGVDTTTVFDVATTTATGIDTGRPNPPSITPSTAGAWIVVAGAGGAAAGAIYTNPGDLSSTTNHFQSIAPTAETNEAMAGIGIKTDWSSGAFDPAQWTGGTTNATDSWAAATMALRPAGLSLQPSLYTNSQTFYGPTLTPGTVTLSPSLYTNSQTFYSATLTLRLTPDLFTNSQTFFSPTVENVLSLSPSLYSNSQTFYSPTVTPGEVTLSPSLYSNAQSFFSPSLHLRLEPSLVTNTSTFYSATVSLNLTPSLVTNTQTFYSPTVEHVIASDQTLTVSLFTNAQVFYTSRWYRSPVVYKPGQNGLVL